MRRFTRLSVLMALIAPAGAMAAFAAPASADSITCAISGSIKLSPGLSETPQVQNIAITKHKGAALSGCAGTETTVTGGNVHIVTKTTAPVTCAALAGAGAPVASAGDAIFKWQPSESSTGSLSMPLTEKSVSLSGTVDMGTFPFSEDTISGTVTQKYTGGEKCGVSSGHKKAKKVNKGTFSGSITIS